MRPGLRAPAWQRRRPRETNPATQVVRRNAVAARSRRQANLRLPEFGDNPLLPFPRDTSSNETEPVRLGERHVIIEPQRLPGSLHKPVVLHHVHSPCRLARRAAVSPASLRVGRAVPPQRLRSGRNLPRNSRTPHHFPEFHTIPSLTSRNPSGFLCAGERFAGDRTLYARPANVKLAVT